MNSYKIFINIKYASRPLRWLQEVILLSIIISCPFQILAAKTPPPDITFQYVDPLIKVFRSSIIFPEHEAHDDVARGQYATFQFVIRSNRQLDDIQVSGGELDSGSAHLDKPEIGYVGYIHVGGTARTPAHDRMHPISDYYPDPIMEEPPQTLSTGLSQPVWIRIPIPVDAVPGTYQGNVILTARVGKQPVRIKRAITVRVYPVVVKDTRLWVTNWWRWRDNRLSYMNDGKSVETFSELYWKLVQSLAHTMASYRQNVALISPLRLAQYKVENGQYSIDFSRFDRMVEIFMEEGVIGRIEGRHLADRTSESWDPNSPFQVYVPDVQEDTVLFKKHAIDDEQTHLFYQQFIPALVEHLKEKGWYDIYMQHIADEPTKANASSYIAIASFFRKLAPDLQFIDAALSEELDGLLDTWVPTLDGLDKNYDFYKERLEAGDEVWFYTCVVPQGEYANRFIELPLIKTRILHWINFRYNISGYLHWGFNFWNGNPLQEGSERGLPGGDSWIVYPKKGGVLPSIRLEAMRDGIIDYELLKMLEERQPDKAFDLVRKVVHGFDRYNTSVSAFRKTHRQLLELLSDSRTEENH